MSIEAISNLVLIVAPSMATALLCAALPLATPLPAESRTGANPFSTLERLVVAIALIPAGRTFRAHGRVGA